MELIPWKPMAAVARVLAGGAGKYGIRNWRIDKILASTYVGAINRHTNLEWAQGVDKDKDDGEHPLAHVIASCLLVMDAGDCNTLIDDRLKAESKDPDTGEIKGESLTDAIAFPSLGIKFGAGAAPECVYVVLFQNDDEVAHIRYTSFEGPFLSLEDAETHARINPNNIAGDKSVHAINKP